MLLILRITLSVICVVNLTLMEQYSVEMEKKQTCTTLGVLIYFLLRSDNTNIGVIYRR